MGISLMLAVTFLLFLLVDVMAVIKGEKMLAAAMTVIIAIGVTALSILWVTSPM